MDVIQVEGGYPVTGTVTVEGAKNSALKLMAATLMASGVTTLTNVPNIADVHVMGKVLKNLGAKIEVVDEHVLKIDTTGVDSWETPYDLVGRARTASLAVRQGRRCHAGRLQHRRPQDRHAHPRPGGPGC